MSVLAGTGRALVGRRRRQAGFSLLELAVTLTLVGVLISGGVLLAKSWVDHQKRAETWRYMQEVELAIKAYVRAYQHLPYADSHSDGLDGLEDAGYRVGYLPYAVLGVAPRDAWGRQLKYAMSIGLEVKNCGEMAGLLAVQKHVLPPNYANYTKVYNASANTVQWAPAVLVSAGARNADSSAVTGTTIEPLDSMFDNVGAYSNNAGGVYRNVFIVSSPTATFDDLTLALNPFELYHLEACGSSPLTPNPQP